MSLNASSAVVSQSAALRRASCTIVIIPFFTASYFVCFAVFEAKIIEER